MKTRKIIQIALIVTGGLCPGQFLQAQHLIKYGTKVAAGMEKATTAIKGIEHSLEKVGAAATKAGMNLPKAYTGNATAIAGATIDTKIKGVGLSEISGVDFKFLAETFTFSRTSPIYKNPKKQENFSLDIPASQAILYQEMILQAEARFAEKLRRNLLRLDLYKEDILKAYHLPDNYINAYYNRRVLPYLANPKYTPDSDPTVLYRGMLVTPDELKVILKEGFSPKNTRWNAGAEAGKPAVSFSSSSTEANSYIFQSGYKKDGIGVLFVVRKRPTMELGKDPTLNKTKTIYYSYQEVAPEDILEVSVRGEYGFESLETIFKKAAEGNLKPHETWTQQFEQTVIFR